MESVLLIGYGAMGRTIMRAVREGGTHRVTHVLEMASRCEAVQAELGAGVKVIPSLDALDEVPECVLESAGHAAVKAHVPVLLRRGVDVILVSVGSLADPGLPEELEAAAREGKAQVTLVSGAVPGIDALSAAKPFGLERVVYTGRKPPVGWRNTPAEEVVDLASLPSAATIFEGTAREAARRFPQNANVAATVGLAGVGLDQTRVRLIADPAITRNVHRVEAEGTFGSLEMTMAGNPLAENPKTSALAAYSVVRALRNRAAPVVM